VVESVARSVPHPDIGTELVRDWAPDSETRGMVVLVHGAFEHSGRYEHVGSQMSDAGFHVRSFDLIGGGASGGRRWDTPDWEDFHDQLQAHMEWALEQGPPVILMGHSTGATIALGYVTEDRPEPKLLVLSSPLITARRTWQEAMIPILVRIVPRMHIPSPVKNEDLSRDPSVGEVYHADPLVFTVGTPRFAKAMFEEMERVQSAWSRLTVPTLVFHGGMDKIVPPQGSAPMADLPTVERKLYPSLRHETMNEPEGPEVVQDVIDWIDEHL
jgi:acylglycerol lipase